MVAVRTVARGSELCGVWVEQLTTPKVRAIATVKVGRKDLSIGTS
jgi:hypothetical protein